MDRQHLEERLAAEFGEEGLRPVSRQARDLAEAGDLAADLDVEVTVDFVVSNLADAPEDHSLVERWNWWLGSLELSHGGYRRFRVREDVVDDS